jgi:hypothetical protein
MLLSAEVLTRFDPADGSNQVSTSTRSMITPVGGREARVADQRHGGLIHGVLILPARLERVTGIEPALSAWEADVLPLNYTRAWALGPSSDTLPSPAARCDPSAASTTRRGVIHRGLPATRRAEWSAVVDVSTVAR